MTLAIEAVFEKGVLIPVNPLELAEHQKVHLILQTAPSATVGVAPHWHWKESQAIDDGFTGAVGDELDRQRREG